jgi:uncharacterized protein YuzE
LKIRFHPHALQRTIERGATEEEVTATVAAGERFEAKHGRTGFRMRITYDPDRNIAYIALRERVAQVETIRVSDELNVDLSPDGTVYGIELLNANEQLSGGVNRLLTVINESSGKTAEITL